MAFKHRTSGALKDAKTYYKFLLYHASGGTIGQAPENEVKNDSMTFGEKRGLLDSIIRIAELERKSKEGIEEESGFDAIRKQINAGRENEYRRDSGGSTESAADADSPAGETDEAGESGSTV